MKICETCVVSLTIMLLIIGCSKVKTNATPDKISENSSIVKKVDYNSEKAFLLNPYYVLYSDETVSPSEAEFEDWKSSRRDANGRVKKPLVPEYFDYSEASLDLWVEKDDPLAKYLKAYRIFNRYGCERRQNVMSLLLESYATESKEVFVLGGEKRTEKRVPEAAVVMANVSEQCDTLPTPIKYKELIEKARQGGWLVDDPSTSGQRE